MAIVYLSLGSNLGDREGNLERAIELLQKRGMLLRKRSSLYETEPWGRTDQPLFLNMALEIETALEPRALLSELQRVEVQAGRKKTYRWGPRTVDLDILLYNHIILSEEALKIPHPFMHKREYVLKPLDEIAPDAVHPVLQMRVHELFVRFARHSAKNNGIP